MKTYCSRHWKSPVFLPTIGQLCVVGLKIRRLKQKAEPSISPGYPAYLEKKEKNSLTHPHELSCDSHVPSSDGPQVTSKCTYKQPLLLVIHFNLVLILHNQIHFRADASPDQLEPLSTTTRLCIAFYGIKCLGEILNCGALH